MKYFFTFFLFFLITSPVLATSPKTVKALENCADDMWENKKRDYRKSFKEKIRSYEIDIQQAIMDQNEGYVKTLNYLKKGLEEMGEKEHNEYVVWETTYTKKKLKEKLDFTLYEKYFTKCEQTRSKAPITFEEKWK